jgi:uncharacterized protein YaaN involved in tellurite resistance
MNEIIFSDNSDRELSKEEEEQVNDIKNLIDYNDSSSIIRYGVSIQNNISDYADKILSDIKNKNTGYVGTILSDLMNKLRGLHVDELSASKSFLSKIPFISSITDNAKKFMTRYQSLSTQIVSIVDELEKAKVQLINDVRMLDQFYEKNLEYFHDIALYILAGKSNLKKLNDNVLPEMKGQAELSNDPVEHQKYKDMVQFANRLDKKIHDLKLSRTVALQTGPQIRLVQHANQELAEKIQSSILNTIPLWKHQIVIAITLIKQEQLLGVQKEISSATKNLLEKNAEMLKISSTEIAEEAEKGIVDIETLKKVNSDLISTIDDTIKIQHQGKVKREQAELELRNLEKILKERLLEIKDIKESK